MSELINRNIDNNNNTIKVIYRINNDRYWMLYTNDPIIHQACCPQPYECLGTWCTEDGQYLDTYDPFNDSPINICGINLQETSDRGEFAMQFIKWDSIDECGYPVSRDPNNNIEILVRMNEIWTNPIE